MTERYPELQRCRVSELFLDTTYCDPRYDFPAQAAVLRWVGEVVRALGSSARRTLVVVGAYSIGKERVYLTVAEALDALICVDAERRRTLMVRSGRYGSKPSRHRVVCVASFRVDPQDPHHAHITHCG